MSPPTVPQDPRRELEMLLASRFALIVIESREEARVLSLVRESSLKARRGRGWGVFQWTVTEGLQRVDVDMGAPQRMLAEPAQLLRHLKATPMPGIYVLLDFHPYLTDPINVRMLKDVAQGYEQVARTVVLMSYEVTLPEELESFATRMQLALPSAGERQMIVKRVAQEWSKANPGRTAVIEPDALSKLVDNLCGLTAGDAERLVRQAIFDDGALTMSDLQGVLAAKYQLLNRGGTLTYEPDTAKFADVGGMQNLRNWLTSRKPAFDGAAPELVRPRARCSSACRAAVRAWLRAPRPASSVCRCCDWTSVRSTASGTGNRKRICANRSSQRVPWPRVCCGSTKSKKRSRMEKVTAVRRAACSARSSPGSRSSVPGSS